MRTPLISAIVRSSLKETGKEDDFGRKQRPHRSPEGKLDLFSVIEKLLEGGY